MPIFTVSSPLLRKALIRSIWLSTGSLSEEPVTLSKTRKSAPSASGSDTAVKTTGTSPRAADASAYAEGVAMPTATSGIELMMVCAAVRFSESLPFALRRETFVFSSV